MSDLDEKLSVLVTIDLVDSTQHTSVVVVVGVRRSCVVASLLGRSSLAHDQEAATDDERDGARVRC